MNFRHLMVSAWLAIGSFAAFAQPLIVDTAGVEQALQRGAIFWGARDADEHAAGQIPGAVNFGDVGDLFRDPNREDPPSAAVAAQLLGNAGIDILKRGVVVYGAKANSFPYFGARMLEY